MKINNIDELFIVTAISGTEEEILVLQDNAGRHMPMVAHKPEEVNIMVAIAKGYANQSQTRCRVRKFSNSEIAEYILPMPKGEA